MRPNASPTRCAIPSGRTYLRDGAREGRRTARRTTILTVNGVRAEANPRIPGADIATVIARHGIRVEVRDVEAGAGASVGDTLLSEAAGLDADLLVMGAYGHARWQELVMGGATRTVLQSMTVPVLMSH
ncbi:hypothetical protein LMG28614_03003 [Paraburkholderia ultramafica]|uniref:UspA domain-containing protein n=1 Tax=Paraburkholderia ultramafica TaxID=1544867 RepID=A0A6S7BIR9_9BURK|nr:hypothetical protein LMG28614_03003 [Paraburkholderia ultramafica]